MAQFRTTADAVNAVLLRCGEVTNGNSSYVTRALDYLNKVHHAVIAGGNIFDIDVDQTWSWARAKHPIIIELLPKYTASSASLTNGDEGGTFSPAPSISLKGYHVKFGNDREIYKIIKHDAASSSFQLDANYVGDTSSAASVLAYKVDYDLIPTHLYIDNTNDKIDFEETNGSPTVATLTTGSYTPDELATEVATALNAAAGTSNTYTCAYNAQTRKFTLTSNLAGGGTVFELLGSSGTNSSRSALPTLGFDDLDTSSAANQTSVYILGGISRMIEPLRIYKSDFGDAGVYGVDSLTLQNDYPLTETIEGFPRRFAKIHEGFDGSVKVRFDRYVKDKTKIEIEWIPVPRDLQNNTTSIPLLPRKYLDILEYGASYFIMTDKEDDRSQVFFQLASQQLKAMQKHASQEQEKTGKFFGEIVPREDKVMARRRLRYGYAAEEC